MPAAEALAAAGLAPVELAAKEGLALINGTDGMLGMLVMAIADLRRLLRTADVAAAMCVEGQLGTDRVFAPELQAIRPHPGQALSAANLTRAARRLRRRGLAPRPGLQPGPGRLLAALLAAGARRRARHRGARRRGRRPRARLGGRQPGGARRGGQGRVQRQLPRRPGRLRPGLPGDRRRRRGLDQRAAHRPVPRQGPQPRAAAVPRRRPRRRQRAHDRAVHPGRHRLGAEAAGRAGLGRLHPLQRHAGGPRLDGLVGRPQAAPLGRRAHPGRRRRGAHRRPRPRPAPAAGAVAGHRCRRTPAARQRDRGPRARPPPLARDRDRRRAGPVGRRPRRRRRSDRRSSQ